MYLNSWLRVARGVLEGCLVLIVMVLLAAFARQVAAIGWGVIFGNNAFLFDFARVVALGAIPYRDFGFEYPPLALVPMVLPYITGGHDVDGYLARLAGGNLLVVLATAGCLAYLAHRGWSAHGKAATLALYALLVAATPILFWGFDSVPALLTVVAICAIANGHSSAAGVALGAGFLVKLYPLVLVPLLGLHEFLSRSWPRLSSLLAGVAGSAVVGLLAALAVVGTQALSFLEFQTTRGVQLESIPASIALAAHLAGGPPARPFVGSGPEPLPYVGAWQIQSPFIDSFGWLWLIAVGLMGGVLLVSAGTCAVRDMSRHGFVRPQTAMSHLLGAVLLSLLASRVLSPQYLVWLLPIAALLSRTTVMLVVAACALTLYLVPFGYDRLVELQPDSILVLVARNLLLIGLFLWLVAPGVRLAIQMVSHRQRAVH